MLTLTLKAVINLPLEMSGITPDLMADKSRGQVERIPVWYGNQQLTLGELFRVTGSSSDEQLTLTGDFHAGSGIGARMKSGTIRVEGHAGYNVGVGMWAGEIEVDGDAYDNLGAEMRGGTIRVRGSAGANVGGPLAGSKQGMTGGAILIDSHAGDSAGQRMRRGLIALRGTAGNYLGHGMQAGSIVALGVCGSYPGVEMSRGTICLAGTRDPQFLPTFIPACVGDADVLRLIGRYLQSLGFDNDLWDSSRKWQAFNGDFLVSGRGEVFVTQL